MRSSRCVVAVGDGGMCCGARLGVSRGLLHAGCDAMRSPWWLVAVGDGSTGSGARIGSRSSVLPAGIRVCRSTLDEVRTKAQMPANSYVEWLRSNFDGGKGVEELRCRLGAVLELLDDDDAGEIGVRFTL